MGYYVTVEIQGEEPGMNDVIDKFITEKFSCIMMYIAKASNGRFTPIDDETVIYRANGDLHRVSIEFVTTLA